MGFGHSRSLEEIGLYEHLQGRAAAIYRHTPPQSTPEDDRLALQTDVYFLSANAVCRDGHIVNIDGTGNRVAASCFGPKHVVFVIGRNKIVKTLDEALERARQVSIILSRKNPKAAGLPCIAAGRCMECFSPGCPCGVIAVHRKRLFGKKVSVLLIGEDLGL